MSKYRLFKAAERQVAKLLGGKRVGHLGGADVLAGDVAAEVKVRGQLPRWLVEAMDQAEGHAGERWPIVVLHQRGKQYKDALVVTRLSHWLERSENDGKSAT